ncbi:hypothetical protein AcV5_004242 [Taiwanofungus camphoratus]|nr:hypothetical protein AcV5_004242 [Antrodia cinnamomea]
MADPQSENEFDSLPDVFEGIDWNTVPELGHHPPVQAAPQDEEDKFDDLPDPFAGIDLDAIPDLAAGGSSATAPETGSTAAQAHNHEDDQVQMLPSRPTSSHSSTQYSFDNVDASFMREVDALEARLSSPMSDIGRHRTPTQSTNGVPSGLNDNGNNLLQFASLTDATTTALGVFSTPAVRLSELPQTQTISTVHKGLKDGNAPGTLSRKRTRSESSSSELFSTRKKSKKNKGKEKGKSQEVVDPNAGVKKMLAEFEDELTCPICCDILASAHLGNPCGHTICGDCGWSWISKNKRSPTCAICRTKLVTSTPMIPNIAMDNTVEKHINALAASGSADWQPSGVRHTEWSKRKEKWKAEVSKRAAEARRVPPAPQHPPFLPGAPRLANMSDQDIINLVDYFENLDEDYVVSGDDNMDDNDDEGSTSSEDDEDSGLENAAPTPPASLQPIIADAVAAALNELHAGRGGRGGGQNGRGNSHGRRGRRRRSNEGSGGRGSGRGRDRGRRGERGRSRGGMNA